MKTAKNLLLPLIVMILLGIGVVVFFAIDKNRNSGGEPQVNKVELLYISPVEFASVSVKHKDSDINVKVDMTISANGSYIYTYSGNDKATGGYSQNLMDEYVSELSSFLGCVLVAEKGNLSEYGLDQPSYTVTITKNDGSTSTILIGDLSPNNEKCYVCSAGSSAVYSINARKRQYASFTAKDFLDRKVADISLSALESVRFERRNDSLDLFANCSYDDSSESAAFKFTKPFEVDSSTNFQRLIENICNLEAYGYEDSSSENLAKFGLSKPSYTVTLRTKNASVFTFDFSSVASGYYYGRLNGSGKIFKVSSNKFDNLESPLLILISSYVFYDTCDNILSVECSGQDNRFILKLDIPKGKAFSDAEAAATLDGRNAKVFSSSGRSYAAMLYESIFCIDIGGVEETANVSSSAVPEMTITIFDRNHSSFVYTFYKRNTESYYVFKNGEYTKFYVFSRELYNDGGTDTYNYGIWPAYDLLTKAITNSLNGVYDIPADGNKA